MHASSMPVPSECPDRTFAFEELDLRRHDKRPWSLARRAALVLAIGGGWPEKDSKAFLTGRIPLARRRRPHLTAGLPFPRSPAPNLHRPRMPQRIFAEQDEYEAREDHSSRWPRPCGTLASRTSRNRAPIRSTIGRRPLRVKVAVRRHHHQAGRRQYARRADVLRGVRSVASLRVELKRRA